MTTVRRPIAVLDVPRKDLEVSLYARSIATAFTGNAYLPSPTVPISTFLVSVAAYESAQLAAMHRGKGTVSARKAARAVVIQNMQQLRSYAQGAADSDMENGAVIIESAGMKVKKVFIPQKRMMKVEQGSVAGTVILFAVVAGLKVGYLWQWSTDQKTWTALLQVFVSKTSASGLTPGITYYFRYQVISRSGLSDWSQIISFLVK